MNGNKKNKPMLGGIAIFSQGISNNDIHWTFCPSLWDGTSQPERSSGVSCN
jgi:hypothetical protein